MCLLQIFIKIYNIEVLREIVALYPVYQRFSKRKINNLELFHKSNMTICYCSLFLKIFSIQNYCKIYYSKMDILLCNLNLNKGCLIISALWLCVDKFHAPRLVRTMSVSEKKNTLLT